MPEICVHPSHWSVSTMVRWRSKLIGLHGVVQNIGGSRRRMITVTVQLTSASLVIRNGSLLMTRTAPLALHARCATAVPSATIRVQNYVLQVLK